MRKLITLSLTVFLVGLFAAVVYAAVQPADDSVPAGTVTTETTETTTTSDDLRREDRPDNRREDRRDDRREDRRVDEAPATGAVDVSGPCDEAEHANDPRCAGAPAPRVEDDQRNDDDRVDDHGEDRRTEVEDHSGPGHGGDDNSGPGHGGRDHEEDD